MKRTARPCRLVPLASALAAVLLGAWPASAAAQEARSRPFSHADHVRKGWLQAELDRDCRGCHDYSSPDPARRPDPKDRCARCHVAQDARIEGRSAVDPRGESGGTAAGDGVERFNHHEHWRLECSRCHLRGLEDVPPVMPLESLASAAACGGCHGLDGKAADKREQFDRGINARLARRGQGDFGDFRHDQHIKAEALRGQDPKVCQECHPSVQAAGAKDLGEKQFSVEGCGKCHAGVRFDVRAFETPSRAVATFLHAKHLAPGALAQEPELGAKGCYACHRYEAGRDAFELGPRFEGGVYEGCVSCHQHAEQRVERHGEIDDCRKCHDLDGGALGQFVEIWIRRPAKVEVARPPPATFEIGSQAHPFITGAKGADEACKECHVARIPELASRLSGKPFSHATHLAGDAAELHGACRACHRSMSEAAGPADILFPPAEGHGSPLYELDHCRKCHRSESLAARAGGPPAVRRVLRFSHQDHLSRKHPTTQKPLTCVDCHEPAGARVELKPSVNECTECHRHGEGPAPTQRYTKREVEACAFCHQVGVPARKEPVPVERLALDKVIGTRTHPRGGDCVECHELQAGAGSAPPRPRELAMTAEYATPHESPAVRADRYFEKNAVGDRTTYCFDCHWGGDLQLLWKNRDLIERQPWYARFNEEHEWRKEFGNLVDAGFPGIGPPP